MLAVKLIRQPAVRLEGEINAFLQMIGSQPQVMVDVKDIKLLHIGGKDDLEEAMIIYNQWIPKENTKP